MTGAAHADLPEVDERSHISYPDLSQRVNAHNNNTPGKVDAPRRRSDQDLRHSGAGSVFSGTTARTSRSGQELLEENAQDMIDALEDFADVSDKILRVLLPQEVSEASIQSIKSRLSDPKSRESKQLRRHTDYFKSQHKAYGNDRFIQARLVAEAVLDVLKPGIDHLNVCRMDPVLYKANVTTLIMASLAQSDDSIEHSVDEFDEVFPTPFLNSFVDTVSVRGSPDSSALMMETFRLALDIRTRRFIENARRKLGEPNFDPDGLLQSLFYRKGNGLYGWNVAGMRSDDLARQPRLKNAIVNRLDRLRTTFSEDEASPVDFESLDKDFSHGQLTTEVMYWTHLRLQEVETQLQSVEGVSGIVRALQSTLESGASLSHGSHASRVFSDQERPSKPHGFLHDQARGPSISDKVGSAMRPLAYEYVALSQRPISCTFC